MEVIIVSSKKRKITARGFLIGPWCPIYGFWSLFIILLLKKYYNDPVFLFTMSFLIGTFLEYMTSYIMEKLFHARWWNYSDHKFQINGRVSLTTSLGFGILGLILIYILNPFFLKIIKNFPEIIFNIIMIIILIIHIIDIITSYKIISNIKIANKNTNIKDLTEKYNEEVKKVLKINLFLTVDY